ncbi:hypothetical protein PoB_004429600 [Plakobranchus ocellatus]|uniref:Uncharacterized protein n=1 Tax=Plakobranchus ocellatus TaxID=259542 RepID=A0AAV4BG20_9GAST|nr:hypothetical protein PoB_004429600 [Plakobranchus ocellatus]
MGRAIVALLIRGKLHLPLPRRPCNVILSSHLCSQTTTLTPTVRWNMGRHLTRSQRKLTLFHEYDVDLSELKPSVVVEMPQLVKLVRDLRCHECPRDLCSYKKSFIEQEKSYNKKKNHRCMQPKKKPNERRRLRKRRCIMRLECYEVSFKGIGL